MLNISEKAKTKIKEAIENYQKPVVGIRAIAQSRSPFQVSYGLAFVDEKNANENDKILIQIVHSTQKEIQHPNTPIWVKQEADNLIYTLKVQLESQEIKILRKIESILAGNGKVENIAQDARHVFEAQKYGSYFITTDNRILKMKNKIHKLCNVTILKPSEFLSLVMEELGKA